MVVQITEQIAVGLDPGEGFVAGERQVFDAPAGADLAPARPAAWSGWISA